MHVLKKCIDKHGLVKYENTTVFNVMLEISKKNTWAEKFARYFPVCTLISNYNLG